MWYVRDVLYAVVCVCVSCFVVRGCGVSRRYIDVCYCDMFSQGVPPIKKILDIRTSNNTKILVLKHLY